MTNPNPNSGDVDQREIIEDGMQGADGSTNADGLDPNADPQERLAELQENLGELAGEATGQATGQGTEQATGEDRTD